MQELTVGELCNVVQLPQSTVSRHLRLLSDEGWVASRAEGTSRYYRLDPQLGDGAKQLWDLVSTDLGHAPKARQDAERVRAVVAKRRARSRAFFAQAASDWEKVRESLFGERASLIGLLALIDENSVVGDLGCGTGHLTRLLSPFVKQILGVDASTAMLELARAQTAELSNVELRSGELESLPLADESLDAAILALVLHNVADPSLALREAGRVLRRGGRLLVLDMVPHERDDLRAKFGHVWQGFSAEQMNSWFGKAGFVRSRYVPLPPDVATEGPSLFVASAVKVVRSP
jgi:ArsR family transcriptional regulator